MGAASYQLFVRAANGTTALAVGINSTVGYILVYDALDGPWPIRFSPSSPPPTGELPVFDASGAPRNVQLTPYLVDVDLLSAASAFLEHRVGITPGTIDASATVLPITLLLEGEIDPAILSAASQVLTPTIVRSDLTIALGRLDVLEAVAETLDPDAAGPTAGTLHPGVTAAGSAVLNPEVVHGEITRTPPVIGAASSVLTPSILMGTRTIKIPLLSTKAAIQQPLVIDTHQLQSNPSPISGASSVLLPTRVMGSRSSAPALLSTTSAVLQPAAIGTGGPPVAPAVIAAASSVLAPALSGTGSRTPNNASAASSVLAPTIGMGTRQVAPAPLSCASSVLLPALIGTKASNPTQTSAAASVLAPGVRYGVKPAIAAAVSSVLEPTIVLVRVVQPPVLGAVASIPTPDVDSPVVFVSMPAAGAAASVLAPASIGCQGSALVLEVPVLESVATVLRGTPVHDLVAADIVLTSRVTTAIDFSQEHDVTPELQQNQVGVRVDIPLIDSAGVPLNLEGAPEVRVWLRPPVGASKGKNGVVLGEPTNGIVRYTTEAGDLNQHGVWAFQATVKLANGDRHWSAVHAVRVLPNIGPPDDTINAVAMGCTIEILEPTIIFIP